MNVRASSHRRPSSCVRRRGISARARPERFRRPGRERLRPTATPARFRVRVFALVAHHRLHFSILTRASQFRLLPRRTPSLRAPVIRPRKRRSLDVLLPVLAPSVPIGVRARRRVRRDRRRRPRRRVRIRSSRSIAGVVVVNARPVRRRRRHRHREKSTRAPSPRFDRRSSRVARRASRVARARVARARRARRSLPPTPRRRPRASLDDATLHRRARDVLSSARRRARARLRAPSRAPRARALTRQRRMSVFAPPRPIVARARSPASRRAVSGQTNRRSRVRVIRPRRRVKNVLQVQRVPRLTSHDSSTGTL